MLEAMCGGGPGGASSVWSTDALGPGSPITGRRIAVARSAEQGDLPHSGGRRPPRGGGGAGDLGLGGRVIMCLALLSAVWGTAAPPPAETAPPASASEEEIVIEGSTQGHLDGVGVGVGNIWEGEYVLPDGARRSGLSAGLWIGGRSAVRVGPGSVVAIGPGRWEVVLVESDGRGRVRLRRVAGP